MGIEISDQIGQSALKIADLSTPLENGYILDLDKALSFEGKTGPGLLYAMVRIQSILNRNTNFFDTHLYDQTYIENLLIEHWSEPNLALSLLDFDDSVHSAANSRAPHILAQWAFNVVVNFNRFYFECPILTSVDKVKNSRLMLCKATQIALSKALWILNCEIPSRM